MIDILIPVLGRPQNAAPLVQNIRDVSSVDHTINFVCSADDTEQVEACIATGANVMRRQVPAGQGDFARKVNIGFNLTTSEWIFMGDRDRKRA